MKRHHALKHGESISGEVQECAFCGNKTRVKPCRTDLENTCSKECQNKLHSNRMGGDSSPVWDGGTDKIECDFCGDIFEEYESQRRGDNSFCSNSCFDEYRSVFVTGPNNPLWKDKPDYNYSNGWKSLSDEIRQRDGKCVLCGVSLKEYKSDMGRNPDVHHIIPSDVFHGNGGDFKLNLITLCRMCHRKIESGNWQIEPEVLLALVPYM